MANSKGPASITSFSILEFTSNNLAQNHPAFEHHVISGRGITQEVSVPQTNKSGTSLNVSSSQRNEDPETA